MRRWFCRFGVVSALLVGCAAPEPATEQAPSKARAPVEGPLNALLMNKINPQTLGTVINFGQALALDGNTLACGDELYSDTEPRRGAVFIFERTVDEFEQVDVLGLIPRMSSLGGYVTLDGPRLCTTEFDGFGGNRVYAYERRGPRFQLDAKLAPLGQTPVGFPAGIAVSKDTAIVGSVVYADQPGTGSALVFVRTANGWVEQAMLVPRNLTVNAFGQVVAIENDLAAVGFAADRPGPSVWIFERSAGRWTEQTALSASDSTLRNRFGQAIAISAGRVYVGAPGSVTPSLARQAHVAQQGAPGAVYEYTKIDGTWLEQKLTARTTLGGELGSAISADWPRLLVGAPAENLVGAAYVFTAENGEWDPDPLRIVPTDGTGGDEFGRAVAMSGSTVMVGAPGHDSAGPDRGTVYHYAIGLAPGSKCTTSAECAGWCVNNLCCNRRCDGGCETCEAAFGAAADGECTSYPTYTEVVGCLPMLCSGIGTCPTDCRGAGCFPSHYCDQLNGQCVPRGDAGAVCKGDAECLSEACDEGLCCDRGCDTCFSCRKSLTGVTDGICAPVFAGTDPHFVCDADPGFPGNCGADGKCDGIGKCRQFAPPTTPCGSEPAMCLGDTISGELCNGLGGCGIGQASCAPNECRDGFCTESCRSDRDCSDKAFCTPMGTCVPTRPNGKECQRDAECDLGFCTDGVCCSARCDGQCESCRGKGTEGTCTAVFGDPAPGRPACQTSNDVNSCVSAQCNGDERFECTSVVVECGAYACEAGRCKRSCTERTSSADCARDAVCLDPPGRCIQTVPCDPGACSPYACDRAGRCATRCTSSLECAGGHSCNSRGDCVRRAETAPFGCACQLVTPEPGPAAWWLVAVFGLSSRRRRRSASR
jgi:MYXO-CTERM domain-containing protein